MTESTVVKDENENNEDIRTYRTVNYQIYQLIYTILEESIMAQDCIANSKMEETVFNYTMSLIQGKYKMFILYTLMEFGVVRFNEMQKYIGTITFKLSVPH